VAEKRGQSLRYLGRILRETGRPAEALECHEKAVAVLEEVAAAEIRQGDTELWRVYDFLAQSLAATGRPREANEARRQMARLVPANAATLNHLAWQLATSDDPDMLDASVAVELATRGLKLEPKNTMLPNTLGVAHFRAGNLQDSIDWLTESGARNHGLEGFDWFFVAMAHWRLGHKDEAHQWHAKAIEWMDTNRPTNHELVRFRAEAEELMKRDDSEPAESPSEKTEARPP